MEETVPGFVLVRNGMPAAEIVLADKPTRSAQFAAYELRHCVKRMTGAELKIVSEREAGSGPKIFVGATDYAGRNRFPADSFQRQEYAVKVIGENLVIAGKDQPDCGKVSYDASDLLKMKGIPPMFSEPGTLYGMYDFLENSLGVRWYNQTESGTVFPSCGKDLSVRVREVRRSPFMKYRIGFYYPGRYDTRSCLWLPNTPGFTAWQQAAYPELAARYRNSPEKFQQARAVMSELFLLRRRNGGEESHCNHSFNSYHDRFWEVNPKRPAYFESKRPELFAKTEPPLKPEQMCFSSEALLRQVMTDADAYFKGTPPPGLRPWMWGERFFAVVPHDNSFFCKCEECSSFEKKHPRQIVFHFVNKAAREMKKQHPDKQVSCLAYAQYLSPPEFPLENNVVVHFCFYNSHEPEGCPGQLQQLKLLERWKKEHPETPLYLWLYGCFPRLFARYGNWFCFPGFHAREAEKQYRLFHKYDIRGIFSDGFDLETDAYIQFNLMDNPLAGVETLLDDYFRGMYGKAAPQMARLYREIEQTYHNLKNYPDSFHSRQTFEIAWGCLGTRERMERWKALLADAEKSADTPETRHRIMLFEKSVWSYMLAGRAAYEEKMREPIPSLKVPRVPDAGGDSDKVDWTKAVPMENWNVRGTRVPYSRKLGGRLAHDAEYLYVELNDPCDTSRLVTSAGVFAYDDWELLFARQRGQPFRMYAVSPKPHFALVAFGEVNMLPKIGLPLPDGIYARSFKESGLWRTRIAFRFNTLLDSPLRLREKLYMNVLRITNPDLAKVRASLDIASWMSFSTVNDPARLAELIFE